MKNFVRFHAIESRIELSQEFWEKRDSSVTHWAMCIQIASFLFVMIYILYINFWTISSTKNQHQRIRKIPKNCNYSTTCRAIFTKSWKTYIYVRITLNMEFHEILFSNSWATLATKFLLHSDPCMHTDRQTFSWYSQMVVGISQNV